MIGNSKVTIDTKGRMIIPTKFRNDLEKDVVISFEFEGLLVIRKKSEWQKWEDFILSLSLLNKSARNVKRENPLFGHMVKCGATLKDDEKWCHGCISPALLT